MGAEVKGAEQPPFIRFLQKFVVDEIARDDEYCEIPFRHLSKVRVHTVIKVIYEKPDELLGGPLNDLMSEELWRHCFQCAKNELNQDVRRLYHVHQRWSMDLSGGTPRNCQRRLLMHSQSYALTEFRARRSGDIGVFSPPAVPGTLPDPTTSTLPSYEEALGCLAYLCSGKNSSTDLHLIPIAGISHSKDEDESTQRGSPVRRRIFLVGGYSLCPERDQAYLQTLVARHGLLNPDGRYEPFEWDENKIPTDAEPPTVSEEEEWVGPLG